MPHLNCHWLLAYCYSQLPGTINQVQQHPPQLGTWMGDRISMSISGDSPSDETINEVFWRCSCGYSMNDLYNLTSKNYLIMARQKI